MKRDTREAFLRMLEGEIKEDERKITKGTEGLKANPSAPSSGMAPFSGMPAPGLWGAPARRKVACPR